MEPLHLVEMEPGKCSIGTDLGSKQSEITITHFPIANRPPHLVRVPFNGSFAHPERPTLLNHSGSNFDFPASYAVVGDKIVCGRSSVSEDDAFPLKNLLLLYSGITDLDTLTGLPGGLDALQAYFAGTITEDSMRDALLEHFRLLHEMALIMVEELGLEIVRVCLTFPNYLCPHERTSHFLRYTSSHEKLQRRIYGPGVAFYHISEGQSATAYVTLPWSDPLCSFARKLFWDDLSKIRRKKPTRFFVVDGGSSSLNCQLQSVTWDELGQFIAGQSINDHGWITGVQGGSHIVNYNVRELLTKKLETLRQRGELAGGPGELAALLNSFEMQKGGIDWTDMDLPVIVLHGKQLTVPLFPGDLRKFFSAAFADGLAVLKAALSHVIKLGHDFVVIFCGGSFNSPGLRNLVSTMMADARDIAAPSQVSVQHVFLAEYDTASWSSAVSAGAALSVARMPRPVDVLANTAAVGIQLLWRGTRDRPFVGENVASFLFCMGGGNTASVTIFNSPGISDLGAFKLVCDPGYLPKYEPGRVGSRLQQLSAVRQRKKGRTHCYRDIKILALGAGVDERDLPPYDLGFSGLFSRLPPGYVRFTLAGADVKALAQDHKPDKLDLVFELICCRTDERGRRLLPHKLDKRWLLKITSAPGTFLLEVEDEKEMPLRCGTCLKRLKTVFYKCTTCASFTVCWDCHSTRLKGHDQTHDWEAVEDKFSQESDDSFT